MNIDRNNYEMYFLLYVDNELPAEQRDAVEKFVAENTDLQAELDLLKQTALAPEEIVFNTKDILYKSELTPGKFQEQLLLQLDDELTPESSGLLAAEIAANDDLKKEWNILQQTKLDPNEKIVFTDKKSLYRRERDRVIPMYFWRVAAAILIIVLAIFIGVNKFSGNKPAKDVANNDQQASNKIVQPGQTANAGQENKTNDQQPVENMASVNDDTNNIVKENDQQPSQKNIVSASKQNIKISSPGIDNDPQQKQDKEDKHIALNTGNKNPGKEVIQKDNNNLPKPYSENINKEDRNKIASSPVQDNIKAQQNKNEQEKKEEEVIAKAGVKEPGKIIEDKELTGTDNGYAKNAVVDESGSETNNNSVLFINEEKINRSKLSGLFRKVKRVLARNANIKTGKNVKIAGFDIATR